MAWRSIVGATVVFLVVFPVVLIAGVLAVPLDYFDRRGVAQNEVDRLKNEWMRKKRMALNLHVHRQELRDIDRLLRKIAPDLPDASDRTFSAVRSAVNAHRLRLDALAAAQAETITEFYAYRVAQVGVTGRYHQVGAFIADVSRLPGSMTFESFVIQRSTQPGLVAMKGVLRAHRDLSDEEVAAMLKARAKR